MTYQAQVSSPATKNTTRLRRVPGTGYVTSVDEWVLLPQYSEFSAPADVAAQALMDGDRELTLVERTWMGR